MRGTAALISCCSCYVDSWKKRKLLLGVAFDSALMLADEVTDMLSGLDHIRVSYSYSFGRKIG